MQGLPLKIVQEALRAARGEKFLLDENQNDSFCFPDGRNHIIDIMNKTINEPRKTKKKNTPALETLTIPSHKRGRFLGINGLNLKKILAQTGQSGCFFFS